MKEVIIPRGVNTRGFHAGKEGVQERMCLVFLNSSFHPMNATHVPSGFPILCLCHRRDITGIENVQDREAFTAFTGINHKNYKLGFTK